ncbi:MAG: carbohydrate porin [Paludibacteraceae bacterium]|nr:carbohydrate porin [Paludibacteraceae bacterium]
MVNRLTFFSRVSVGLLMSLYSYTAKAGDTISVAEPKSDGALSADFCYNGDVAVNTWGGVKQGARYIGCSLLGLQLDIEEAGGWKGGEVRVSGVNTHGGGFSDELVGDRFCVDNNDTGDYTFLTEVWYKQDFGGRVDFSIGLQDISSNFAVNDESSLFINTSAGMNTVFSTNITAPSFPLTGLGFELGWNIDERWRWQACVYDGYVDDLEDNEWNTNWKLNKNEGFVLASEWRYADESVGTYKLGIDYHTEEELFGVYASGERHLNEKVALFSQLAYAPKEGNEVYAVANLGANFYKLFSKRSKDVLGVVCVSNLLTDEERHETIFELTYKCQLAKILYVQPDVQYVINPSAQEEAENALVAILRLGVEL